MDIRDATPCRTYSHRFPCLVLTAVLLLGGLCGCSTADAQSTPFDSVRTETYILHAPSQPAITESRPRLDSATARFRSTFGVTPPRISVVLVEDPSTLPSMNLDLYRERGDAFLAFVTPEEGIQNLASSASRMFALNGGALLMGQGATIQVVGVMPVSSTSTPLQKGDQIETLQGRSVQSIGEFRQRYKAVAAGDSLRMRVRSQTGLPPERITYRKREGKVEIQGRQTSNLGPLAPPTGETAGSDSPQFRLDRTLPHEAGHKFIEAYGNVWLERHDRSLSDDEQGQYGHPRLPDWLDEAAATLSEEPSQKEDRLQMLRDRFDERIPLSKLFSMKHPLTGMRIAEADSSDNDGKGAGVRMLTLKSDTDVAERLEMFYAQTLSVAQFILERAGAEGLRQVVDALLREASHDEAFRRVDGLPVSVSVFQNEWTEWVQNSDSVSSS